jgi:hypothetical protein
MPVLIGGDADVDGTLIRSIGDDANKLHKLAFAEVHAWHRFETHTAEQLSSVLIGLFSRHGQTQQRALAIRRRL